MSVKVAMEAEETSGRIEAIPHVCSGEEVSYYSNDFSWEDHAVAMRSQVSKIPVRRRIAVVLTVVTVVLVLLVAFQICLGCEAGPSNLHQLSSPSSDPWFGMQELEDGAKDAYVEGCQQNQWENFYSKHQTGQ